MKKFFNEFKEFITRGNVLDMAVGIIMGSAFTAIVNSLVKNILEPIIGIFTGAEFATLSITIDGKSIGYGEFIMSVINFVLIGLGLFIIIKIINNMKTITEKVTGISIGTGATTKQCPYCFSKINIKATRCPECTSVLTSAGDGDEKDK